MKRYRSECATLSETFEKFNSIQYESIEIEHLVTLQVFLSLFI
jgi:hypothetical protein